MRGKCSWKELKGKAPASVSDSALLTHAASLLRDDPGKDFVIICGEREWEVHRTVLQIHSKVLAAACEAGFKVS